MNIYINYSPTYKHTDLKEVRFPLHSALELAVQNTKVCVIMDKVIALLLQAKREREKELERKGKKKREKEGETEKGKEEERDKEKERD